MSASKSVCEVSCASGFVRFVCVDGGLGCEKYD
jgi:hypothetical protein